MGGGSGAMVAEPLYLEWRRVDKGKPHHHERQFAYGGKAQPFSTDATLDDDAMGATDGRKEGERRRPLSQQSLFGDFLGCERRGPNWIREPSGAVKCVRTPRRKTLLSLCCQGAHVGLPPSVRLSISIFRRGGGGRGVSDARCRGSVGRYARHGRRLGRRCEGPKGFSFGMRGSERGGLVRRLVRPSLR